MQNIKYEDIVKPELINNLIENTEFIGFKEDYFVIQSLLLKWRPNHIFEIGTNNGNGCRMMKHASPSSKITTLDIISNATNICPSDVIKVIGDSMTYDYSKHFPIDCWFIDGAHDYAHVYKETTEAIKSNAKYIIYHDADLDEISSAILDSFKNNKIDEKYNLYRVVEPPFIYSSTGSNVTRIIYAEKNENIFSTL